jgi:hypothetical protein
VELTAVFPHRRHQFVLRIVRGVATVKRPRAVGVSSDARTVAHRVESPRPDAEARAQERGHSHAVPVEVAVVAEARPVGHEGVKQHPRGAARPAVGADERRAAGAVLGFGFGQDGRVLADEDLDAAREAQPLPCKLAERDPDVPAGQESQRLGERAERQRAQAEREHVGRRWITQHAEALPERAPFERAARVRFARAEGEQAQGQAAERTVLVESMRVSGKLSCEPRPLERRLVRQPFAEIEHLPEQGRSLRAGRPCQCAVGAKLLDPRAGGRVSPAQGVRERGGPGLLRSSALSRAPLRPWIERRADELQRIAEGQAEARRPQRAVEVLGGQPERPPGTRTAATMQGGEQPGERARLVGAQLAERHRSAEAAEAFELRPRPLERSPQPRLAKVGRGIDVGLTGGRRRLGHACADVCSSSRSDSPSQRKCSQATPRAPFSRWSW